MYVYLFTTNQNSTIHCPCFLNHLKWTWQDLDYYAPSSKLLLTSHSAINCQLKQILMLSFESQKDFFGFLVCLPFITKGSLIWLWNHINLCCSYLQLHNGWIFAHVVLHRWVVWTLPAGDGMALSGRSYFAFLIGE